uniref:Uncharacterized protein n=1 Tax=Eutreptiella gymnastica TaxID=73025 RepID=A0A7S1NTT2_9EUGL|mmetsp:Transcript_87390/g.152135  ORF Transcript_87390/g.152135 Transcript_87390/m.152135 type:complete len:185 (+) Transcript_87390:186-740(+)
MLEDVALWLTAFDTMVAIKNQAADRPRPGWLRATPVSVDPISPLPFLPEMLAMWVQAYEHVLSAQDFPNVQVVEFPMLVDTYIPTQPEIRGIQLKTTTGDLLDFPATDGYVHGLLNPGNSFCIPGNDYPYVSLEAMLGNNTDLRYVQSYIFNPYLMDPSRYIAVPVPQGSAVPPAKGAVDVPQM